MNERELRGKRSTDAILHRIQQDIQAIAVKYSSEKHGEKPPESIIINASSQTPQAITEYYAAENVGRRRKTRYELFRLVLEVGTLLAAITAGGIAYRTFTQVSIQSKATQEQVALTRTQFNLAQRPWLGLDGGITIDALQLTPAFSFESHYVVKNFGIGPAFKVFASKGRIETEVGHFDNAGRTVCDEPINSTIGLTVKGLKIINGDQLGYVLFPNQTQEEHMRSMPETTFSKPRAVPKQFWILGCVTYLDQFMIGHRTRFCMEPADPNQPIGRSTRLRFCDKYNDAGEI